MPRVAANRAERSSMPPRLPTKPQPTAHPSCGRGRRTLRSPDGSGEPWMIDLSADGHVHTAFSSGRDSVSVLVASAEQAGLTELTFADQVGPDTSWLPPYLSSIRRAQQRTDLVLRRG